MHLTSLVLTVTLLGQAPPASQPAQGPTAQKSAPADPVTAAPAPLSINDRISPAPISSAPVTGGPRYRIARHRQSRVHTRNAVRFATAVSAKRCGESARHATAPRRQLDPALREQHAARHASLEQPDPTSARPGSAPSTRRLGWKLPKHFVTGRRSHELYHASPTNGGLQGKPTSLHNALSRVNNGSQRQAIHAYWRLRELTGLYHCALREVEYLKNADARIQVDQERIDQAYVDSARRAEQYKAAAVSAQRQLAMLSNSAGSGELPLATDYGVTDVYHTRYTTLRAQGVVSAEARSLHEEIPVARVYLQGVMELAGAEDHALMEIANNFNKQGNTSELLEKIRTARVHNTAFLRSVRVYNQLIANYATSISIPNRNAKMLADMLLVPSRQHTEVARLRSNIRLQSAEVSTTDDESSFVEPAIREVPVTENVSSPTSAAFVPRTNLQR